MALQITLIVRLVGLAAWHVPYDGLRGEEIPQLNQQHPPTMNPSRHRLSKDALH